MFIYYFCTVLSAILMYGIQKKYPLKKIERLTEQHANKCKIIIDKGKLHIRKSRRKKNPNSILYVIPFLPLFLLSAFRYGIGTDYYYTYLPTFNRIRFGMDTDFPFEPGFYVINKFVASFSNSVNWVLAICALMTFIFVGIAIIQQSEDFGYSMLLFFGTGFFSYTLNGVRQSIIIAMWFFLLKYVKERKFIPFLIFSLAGTLFHSSSIILIPLYFIFQKRVKPKECLIGVVIAGLAGTFLKRIVLLLAQFTKYGNKFAGSDLLNGNFAYSTFAVDICLFIYLLLIYKKLKNEWRYNFLLLSTTLSLICTMLTRVIYLIARIDVLFFYLSLLYLPSTFHAFKSSETRNILRVGFVIFFFLYMFITVGVLRQGESVPYTSILFKH